jgi:hypothetical protein
MRLTKRYWKNNCPDEEIFIKAFLKELSLEEKERLIDHIFACEKCRLRFEAMKELSSKLREAEKDFEGIELLASEERGFRRIAKQRIKELERGKKRIFFELIPARYIAAAAGLLIIVAGLFFILKRHPGEAYREVEKGRLSLIEPVGKISAPPSLFIWTEVKGADNYYFQLIDEELNIIYSFPIKKEPKLTLPASVREKLRKGETYIWKIVAQDVFYHNLDSKLTYFEIE